MSCPPGKLQIRGRPQGQLNAGRLQVFDDLLQVGGADVSGKVNVRIKEVPPGVIYLTYAGVGFNGFWLSPAH